MNIGNYAFQSCSGLTSITIPNSVMSLGVETFYGCSALESVMIGSGITEINKGAFSNCSKLTYVTCMAETVPNTDNNAFGGSNIENATLHVPGTAINVYKTTVPWKNFKEIVALTDQELSVKGVMSDNKCEAISFNLGGLRTDAKQKGLQIVRKSDGTMKKVVRK